MNGSELEILATPGWVGTAELERDLCLRVRVVSSAVCSLSGETANDLRIQTNQSRELR